MLRVWLCIALLLFMETKGYNLQYVQAVQRSKLLLGPIAAKRSSGSGGGALPPTQSDNIQSWGKYIWMLLNDII